MEKICTPNKRSGPNNGVERLAYLFHFRVGWGKKGK